MAGVPTTSTTLLKEIAGDAAHPRWGEFVARYRPMMDSSMPIVDVTQGGAGTPGRPPLDRIIYRCM